MHFAIERIKMLGKAFGIIVFFITKGKFAHLKNLGLKDYSGWANGLEETNYSFDTDYAEVLISSNSRI